MESYTLKEFAEKNQVSVDRLKAELDALGVYILSIYMPIMREDLQAKCQEALNHIKPRAIPNPVPAPTPKPAPTPPPTPVSKAKADPSGEHHKAGFDPRHSYRSLIGRDYIIFTETALWKPKVLNIIQDIANKRMEENTKTQIVLLENVLLQLEESGEDDNEAVARLIRGMKESGMAQLLGGPISREQSTLGNFLNRCALTDTILVLCGIGGLYATVKQRNKKNRETPGYEEILGKDINEDGRVISYNQKKPAFPPAVGKACTPLSDRKKVIRGAIPGEGEQVYRKTTSGGKLPIRLEKEIGSGAEAAVYLIENGKRCAKIFKRDGLSELKERKVLLMCEKYAHMQQENRVILSRIAWPEEPLYNEEGEFLGFTMQMFSDVTPFSHFNYMSFPKLIPGIRKAHQINMAISFVEVVDFLHRQNVILCDINRENILFDSEQRAYLVDLDSAQIADDQYYYPANVAVPEFLPPERIDRKNFSYLREKPDDVWIVQMMLFHMLTPDGKPYATTADVQDDDEPVREGLYPYQAGKNGAANLAGGLGGRWHIIVGHFPQNIKIAFWESFHHDGKYFSRENRRNTGYWLGNLISYQHRLPQLEKMDPNRGKFMPDAPPIYIPAGEHTTSVVEPREKKKTDSIEDILSRLKAFKGKQPTWTSDDKKSWDYPL